MGCEFYVGPVPSEGESPYDSYAAHSDDWPQGPATEQMTALLAKVRQRVNVPERLWTEGGVPLEDLVAHDCIYVVIHSGGGAAEALADRVYETFRAAASEVGLMLYDPHVMVAFLPGNSEPVNGEPPPEGLA